MAKQKISDELKQAIRTLPMPEKDKLLLRLIAKDHLLVEKLHHQLLEDEADQKYRREALAEQIRNHFAAEGFGYWSHTPGLVMMEMRSFSGEISRHVKVTRDKYGEVQLNLVLVNATFTAQRHLLYNNQHRADKFADYVCKKAQAILKKLRTLDRDYYLDFEQDVNAMLQHLQQYPPTVPLMPAYDLPQHWEY